MNVKIIEPLGVDEALVHKLMGQLEDCEYEYYTERSVDQAVLAKRAAGADAIVVANAPVMAEVLRAAPNLRLLSVAFTGLDHIDLAYCEELGILHRFSGMVPSNGTLIKATGYDENGSRVKLTDLAFICSF